jgi:lipopolysaccharide transport system ATP-binding protein
MSSEIAIKVENLSKCYQIYDKPQDRLKQSLYPRLQRLVGRAPTQYFKEFWALKDVSFEVKRGETVGIIGRNGSGKSTLLQMICGTLHPTTGNLQVNGRVAALLELGAGFNPEFTGRENVFISAALFGLSREKTESRLGEIFAFAEIGDFVDQPVRNYSSGMFVRLAFAVIAHVDADILVVDEALAVGDVFFQQKCMRFLRSFQAQGGAMLFVSHDTSAVVNLCQSAVWLRKSLAGDFLVGSAGEVCKAYLKDFYANQIADLPALKASASAIASVGPSCQLDNSRVRVVYSSDKVQENVFEISRFKPTSEDFGARGATFIDAVFVDSERQPIYATKAGDTVSFLLSVQVHKSIVFPAFGFTVKDRLGQFIISEGTDGAFRSSNLEFKSGDIVTAEFSFRMPDLLHGHYSVDIAFAEGLGHDHIQHHWVHDVILITSLKGRLVQGIIGLPDLSLKMIRESGNGIGAI